ncbi:MAG: glycogen debranching enzyme, partial [Corynebacterium urealyticum]
WDFEFGKALMVYLNGNAITETTARGERITDDSFIMIFNAHHEDIEFTLPTKDLGASWRLIVDTADSGGYPEEEKLIDAEGTIVVQPRSTLILRQTEPPVFEDAAEN